MGLPPITSITSKPPVKDTNKPSTIKLPDDKPAVPATQPTPTPTPKDNNAANKYRGIELQNPVSFPTQVSPVAAGARSANLHQIEEILAHKLNSSKPENLKAVEFKALAEKLSNIGGINSLDSTVKAQLLQVTGIETDANLEMIQKIINDPRFNKLPDTFTAMDILDICKKMKSQNIDDAEIMSTFLKPLYDNLDSVDNVKKAVIGACVNNNIVFHDQLHTKENRCDPFINDKDVQDKAQDEEKPTSVAELKNKTVKVDQKNEGVIEVLAGFLGYNRQSQSQTNILEMKLPKYIVDELKTAKTKEDLEKVYKKYESVIKIAVEGKEPVKDTPTPASEAPPPVEESHVETAVDDANRAASTVHQVNNIENIRHLLENKKDGSHVLSNNDIKNISSKLIELGGMAALDSTTRQLVKDTLGIESDDNLKVVNEIVTNPNFKDLSKYINSDKIMDICRALKKNGHSDAQIKEVFLDGLLLDLNNKQIGRAKEHIKDACRTSGIIFHEELHTKEYNSNPFLSTDDIQKLKEWENTNVSVIELQDKTNTSSRKHGGPIGAILGIVGANGSSKTTVDLTKVQIPRYIFNELKNADDDQINAIVEKYKDIIKNALEVTKSK